jgi:hypothetical protein
MNEISNKEDNNSPSNITDTENSQENQLKHTYLTNQQLANKIYPAGKTSTVGEYAENITNDTQTPVDSDADVIREGVKKGLGLGIKILIGIVAFFVISPLILGAILWLFLLLPNSSGSKGY